MRTLPFLSLLVISSPVCAQVDPLREIPEEDSIAPVANEILVIATRLIGAVDAPQEPVITLDENAIASYGASSVTDLLAALSPQTGSGRGRGDGRPLHLINGQRISNFREMMAISPEAIKRVEVLPEEVALRYGVPPNQRVINLILKDNFSSRSIAAEYAVPDRGGFHESEVEASLLRIDGPRRLSLNAQVNNTSLLTEVERKLRQPVDNVPTLASDPDPAGFRSLIDDSRKLALTGAWSTGLGADGKNGALALNGAVTRSDSRSLLGLDMVTLVAPGGATARRSLADPLVSVSRSDSVAGGLSFNKPLGNWQFTATADSSFSDTLSRTDLRRDFAPLIAAVAVGTLPVNNVLPAQSASGSDRARTRDTSARSLATLTGNPFAMPAGASFLTLKAGFDHTRSNNSETRSDGQVNLHRNDLSGGINLSMPLTSRRDNVLGAIGDLTLNLGGGLNRLSDFGTLKDWNAGLTWKITERLGLQASWLVNEAAPSLNQLGNPEQTIENVSVFDFTRGETALVTIITGGNRNLRKERQRDLKLGANWNLPFIKDSNLIVEYFRNRSDDVTQSFPLLTPAIEAAFPENVRRDSSGQLVSIKRKPVTFDKVTSSRLRWGLNLSGSIGKALPGAAPAGTGGPPAGGGFRGAPGGGGLGGPPSGGGMGGGPSRGGPPPGAMMNRLTGGGSGQGRWNVSVYHTLRFTETATIAATGPGLELLGGDALRIGGVPRHEVELEGGMFRNGMGLRFNGIWRAPVQVHANGAPGSADLRFGSTFVLEARIFMNLDNRKGLIKRMPWLKGGRLSLEVENILDSRQKVTDASGAVPLAYQRAYRDPRGRVIEIDFRKMF